MVNLNDFTIIIPAYNEEQGIGQTLKDLFTFNPNFKVIVVNDGSADRTAEVVRSFPQVKLIHHKKNRGYGRSLKTGIESANTKFVLTYDADGQHRPQDAYMICEKMSEGDEIDLAVGARGKEAYQVPIRKPGKWVLKQVANYLAKTNIPDLNSGLRGFKTELILKYLYLMPDGFSFSTTSTLVMFNQSHIVEYFEIITNKRTGISTVSVQHGFDTLILIIRISALFAPLRIFVPLSLFFLSVGLLKGIFIDLIYFNSSIAISSLLMASTGVVVFCFGILADQISAIRLRAT